jgi:hypothetical protein
LPQSPVLNPLQLILDERLSRLGTDTRVAIPHEHVLALWFNSVQPLLSPEDAFLSEFSPPLTG